MKSKPSVPTSGSRLSRAERAHLRFQLGDAARREHARQQRTVHVVRRRVLEQDAAGRDLDALLDQLEHRAATGAVGAPVDRAALDVVEAAHREEVVLLVVVERCLVAQPPPDRIRIRVDLEVVRVVVQLVGHLDAPPGVAATGRRYPGSGRPRPRRHRPRDCPLHGHDAGRIRRAHAARAVRHRRDRRVRPLALGRRAAPGLRDRRSRPPPRDPIRTGCGARVRAGRRQRAQLPRAAGRARPRRHRAAALGRWPSSASSSSRSRSGATGCSGTSSSPTSWPVRW